MRGKKDVLNKQRGPLIGDLSGLEKVSQLNPKLLYCDKVPDRFSENLVTRDSIVEVYLWEAFLLSRSNRLLLFLVEHSCDHGPYALDALAVGRVCYRFTGQSWAGQVKNFLIENQSRLR